MPTLQQQIRTSYQRNAHRPIPGRWIRLQPTLSRYSSRSAVVMVVRDDERSAEADSVIRVTTLTRFSPDLLAEIPHS